jgi:hypothetical protein
VDLISAYKVFVCRLPFVCSFSLMCIVFCFHFFPLCSLLRCKVLASIMAEFSCYFQTFEKLSAQAIGYTSLYPL